MFYLFEPIHGAKNSNLVGGVANAYFSSFFFFFLCKHSLKWILVIQIVDIVDTLKIFYMFAAVVFNLVILQNLNVCGRC